MQDVIYLAGCAVNEIVPAADRIKKMNLEHVYDAAERHMLTAMIAMALESAGVKDTRSVQAIATALRKTAILDAEKAAMIQRLEAAGIWYMPLKGAVLKDDYPKYGMRQMADYDFLFDSGRAEDVKVIMEELGFETKRFGRTNHDVYFKKPVVNFEMHRELFSVSKSKEFCRYYENVKERLVKDKENTLGYHFSPEDFYVYLLAHEYKHYTNFGMGLRSVLDVYVYLKKNSCFLDMEYIERETEKLGIEVFEKNIRSLSLDLFGKGELTEADQDILEYVISCGTYGKLDNWVSNKIAKQGGGVAGKVKFLLGRLFLPMDVIKSGHPFVYEHKILLPPFFVWRIGKALFVRPGRIVKELRCLLK